MHPFTHDVAIIEPARTLQEPGLLQCAIMQWQFGDWHSLARIELETLQYHPDGSKLAFLAAAGLLQIGKFSEAKPFICMLKDLGVSKKSISNMLIAGVHNSLGRAAATARNSARARSHFESAVVVSGLEGDTKLLVQARMDKQLEQIGLLAFMLSGKDDGETTPEFQGTALEWIDFGLRCRPDNPPLLIAAAESAQRCGDLDRAIRYWQQLAAIDGPNMELAYYDRLADAYRQINGFPRGTAEEEVLSGDMDKHDLLRHIHQVLQPKNYFEIGVQTGRSLQLANCPAIGIDPMPMLTVALSSQAQLIHATSDQFFAEHASKMIYEPIELAFIDGMHLFEYVLRDFINVEKYSGQKTLVVIDDILPGHPAQAERDRRTRAWTGDVWKLYFLLIKYRPDLSIILLNSHPTGLLCITGLNPESRVLENNYSELISEFPVTATVPDEILLRTQAKPCASPDLEELLTRLSGVIKKPNK